MDGRWPTHSLLDGLQAVQPGQQGLDVTRADEQHGSCERARDLRSRELLLQGVVEEGALCLGFLTEASASRRGLVEFGDTDLTQAARWQLCVTFPAQTTTSLTGGQQTGQVVRYKRQRLAVGHVRHLGHGRSWGSHVGGGGLWRGLALSSAVKRVRDDQSSCSQDGTSVMPWSLSAGYGLTGGRPVVRAVRSRRDGWDSQIQPRGGGKVRLATSSQKRCR